MPDFEGVATIELFDSTTGQTEACVQATLSNGHTTYQIAAVWATVGVAILAALSSILHTALSSSDGSAQWRIVDVMATMQQVAFAAMLSIEMPINYLQFAKNFAWSVGLVSIQPFQQSIDNTRLETGGSYGAARFGADLLAIVARQHNLTTPNDTTPVLSLNLNSLLPAALTQNTLNIPAIIGGILGGGLGGILGGNGLSGILGTRAERPQKRLLAGVASGLTDIIGALLGRPGTPQGIGAGTFTLPVVLEEDVADLRGLQIYIENANIGAANGFLTFLLNVSIILGFVLVAATLVWLLIWAISAIPARRATRRNKKLYGTHYAQSATVRPTESFGIFLVAVFSRWLLVILPPFFIFAFWQWLAGDSWVGAMVAGIVMGVLVVPFLLYFVLLIVRVRRYGTEREFYDDKEDGDRYLDRASQSKTSKFFGLLSERYRAKYYWFALLSVAMAFIRALFIGFAQGNGAAQAIGLLVVEFFFLLVLCICRVGRNKRADFVIIVLALFRVATWVVCVAILPLSGLRDLSRAIAGFVLLAVTAIPVVFITIVTIWDLLFPFCTRRFWRKSRGLPPHQHKVEKRTPTAASSSGDSDTLNEPASTTRRSKFKFF